MTKEISIYIDFNNLGAYVGLEATLALIDGLGLDVVWWPMAGILNRRPHRIAHESGDDPQAAYKARRLKARQAFELAEQNRNCQRLGISRCHGARRIDGTLAHTGLLYLNVNAVNPRSYIEAVYQAIFRLGDEIETTSAVAGLVSGSGLNGDRFIRYANQAQADWEAHQARLLALGIFDSPAYIIEGECFQGRQHLPLIRWHLMGKNGSPPV